MDFYRPTFTPAALQPPQDRLRSKLGGAPWGFPEAGWPRCPACSYPTSFVAQLVHQPPMIDLGQDHGVLHLFFCANLLCLAYGDPSSCLAIVLDGDQLGSGETRQPPDDDGDTIVNDELWLSGWEAHGDAVRPEQVAAFFDDRAHMALPDEIAHPFKFHSRWNTKTNGVPYWTGHGVTLDPAHISCPPYEFLLQICCCVYVDRLRADADADAAGSPVDADELYVDFVNFGSDGTGFIFIDRTASPPGVRWFWSR